MSVGAKKKKEERKHPYHRGRSETREDRETVSLAPASQMTKKRVWIKFGGMIISPKANAILFPKVLAKGPFGIPKGPPLGLLGI